MFIDQYLCEHFGWSKFVKHFWKSLFLIIQSARLLLVFTSLLNPNIFARKVFLFLKNYPTWFFVTIMPGIFLAGKSQKYCVQKWTTCWRWYYKDREHPSTVSQPPRRQNGNHKGREWTRFRRSEVNMTFTVSWVTTLSRYYVFMYLNDIFFRFLQKCGWFGTGRSRWCSTVTPRDRI